MVHIYTIGYMAEDEGYNRFLRLYLVVHVLDVDARYEQQLLAVVLWLGSCGSGFLPLDRFSGTPNQRRSTPI